MPNALIILAEGFEELEAVTVTDLLVRAGIEVVRAGVAPGPIRASRHTVILPDTTLDAIQQQRFDMVILPGGQPGADHLAADARVLTLLQKQRREERWIAAICAAPRVLIAAGVCTDQRITAFPGALTALDLGTTELTEEAVCVDGKLITSRGPGTAMDFALTLIELLTDRSNRDKVEHSLAR